MAIAPDGAWLATASHDQTLRIWELATSKVRAVMRVDSPLYGCAWNRHWQTLLAAVGDAGLNRSPSIPIDVDRVRTGKRPTE